MRKTAIILVAVMLVSLFGGCGFFQRFFPDVPGDPDPTQSPVPANTSGLSSFSYSYSDSFYAGSYTWTVELVEDGAVFLAECNRFPDYGTMTMHVDQSVVASLNELCSRCGINAWNGFDEVDMNVLDGDGFSLDVTYLDGQTVSAHGSNAYPRGYGDFSREMREILAPLEKELAEQSRQTIIAEGNFGTKLDCIMANFKQQGSSGTDEYQFFIVPADVRDNNVDVTIKRDGETARYFGAVPTEAIDFAAVQALIEKHNVRSWYNYDVTAEDYGNCEWFQLDFGYEDGLDISAYGTEHPAGYDAFRAELLELLIGMVESFNGEYYIAYES